MIKIEDYDIFKSHISTLKEISKDDADLKDIKYMTESDIKAVSFDAVKTEYANNLKLSEEVAESIDGICFFKSHNMFIEFKNGRMRGEAKTSVKSKVRDSLLIFCDITDTTISYTRDNVEFILVYNEEKNSQSHSRESISRHIMDRANMEKVKWKLDKFKTLYFRDVHTYTEKEFDEYLRSS